MEPRKDPEATASIGCPSSSVVGSRFFARELARVDPAGKRQCNPDLRDFLGPAWPLRPKHGISISQKHLQRHLPGPAKRYAGRRGAVSRRLVPLSQPGLFWSGPAVALRLGSGPFLVGTIAPAGLASAVPLQRVCCLCSR